jgi:hypothetical protein
VTRWRRAGPATPTSSSTGEAESLIEEYYGGWEPGYVAPEIVPEPEQTAARDSVVECPARTLPIMSINYKAPAWSATDTMAVALEVLGRAAFGSNSDLYRELVIQNRQVQFLSAGFGLARDPALVDLTAIRIGSTPSFSHGHSAEGSSTGTTMNTATRASA